MNNLPFGVLIGNITSDPALRYTPGQHAVVTFGIAVNTRKKDGNNWVDGPTKFYDVVVWRDLAENVVESIPKGTRVVCVGEFDQRSWEADDGTKRSKIEFVAQEVSPSLRWATATVTRASKGRNGGTDYDPGPAAPEQTRPAQHPPERSQYTYEDEEPFLRDAGEWLPGAPGSWGTYPSSARQ